jgi:hypothetical protein
LLAALLLPQAESAVIAAIVAAAANFLLCIDLSPLSLELR